MILEVDWGERRAVVEVVRTGGRRIVKIDGKEILCDIVRLQHRRISLILDGCVYDFIIEFEGGEGGGCVITGRGGTYVMRMADPRRLKVDSRVESGNSGLQRVRTDMPGKVVRVLVCPGDAVAYDQPLLVLEAMKMQNEIRSPKTGVVRELGVAAGLAVGAGDFLLSIE